jgi:hypothetical protein
MRSRPLEEVGFVYGSGSGKLPYIGTARRTYPGDAYHPAHQEADQPPSSSWNRSPYGPPTNPGAADSLVDLCRAQIINNDVCQGDASCRAGVCFQHDPFSACVAPEGVARLDHEQFDIGRALQRRCVGDRVASYFDLQEVD